MGHYYPLFSMTKFRRTKFSSIIQFVFKCASLWPSHLVQVYQSIMVKCINLWLSGSPQCVSNCNQVGLSDVGPPIRITLIHTCNWILESGPGRLLITPDNFLNLHNGDEFHLTHHGPWLMDPHGSEVEKTVWIIDHIYEYHCSCNCFVNT